MPPNFYIDPLQSYPSGSWCHLWTDGTRDELDAFAARIGMKKAWAQLSRGRIGDFYHYDLRASKRALALKAGAQELSLAAWVKEKMK